MSGIVEVADRKHLFATDRQVGVEQGVSRREKDRK
jgi:hypothetical protein